MPIDRVAVKRFITSVSNETVSFIRANAKRFTHHDKLVDRFESVAKNWCANPSENIHPITDCVNELCIAREFLEYKETSHILYEPSLKCTGKTIDYLVELADGRRILFDVKTVHPEAMNKWGRYKRIINKGLLSGNNIWALDKDGMGGQWAHLRLASREKFLSHTIDLEAKIDAIENKSGLLFAMVFCGNGTDWTLDQLEDFADFYMTGQHRYDDLLAEMEEYYIEKEGIALSHTINSFCYLERKITRVLPCKFVCGVRGPTFLLW